MIRVDAKTSATGRDRFRFSNSVMLTVVVWVYGVRGRVMVTSVESVIRGFHSVFVL